MTSAAPFSELLCAVSGSLSPGAGPLDAWRAVTSSLSGLLAADAAVALVVGASDRMQVAASYGWPAALPVDAFPIAPDSQARYVLDHGGGHVIDAMNEQRFVTGSMVSDAGFVQSCTARVLVDGCAVGLIGLQFRTKRHLTPEHVQLVDAACTMLGAILGQHRRLSRHERLVDHDFLTDLVNRRKLWEVLDHRGRRRSACPPPWAVDGISRTAGRPQSPQHSIPRDTASSARSMCGPPAAATRVSSPSR